MPWSTTLTSTLYVLALILLLLGLDLDSNGGLFSEAFLQPSPAASPCRSRRRCPQNQHSVLLKLKSQEESRTRSLQKRYSSSFLSSQKSDSSSSPTSDDVNDVNIWEEAAGWLVDIEDDPSRLPDFVQYVTLLRVGLPSLFFAASAKVLYPIVAMFIADHLIQNDSGVFAVVAQDASQYIQNVLTTSGLVFSLLVGQTYYFMYQQQEKIFLALFEEVTMAKSLLEQVALVCQGRDVLYKRILECICRYVQEDLTRFNDVDPAIMISARPIDDPLEDVLFLTSVGEPSIVYQTIKSLRQARAFRLGSLQRKLPSIHMLMLWILAAIVLLTFPLLGAGSQTIGGLAILNVQSWYFGFIVFGITITMGVIYELRRPGEQGAYNARTVLSIMLKGLEEELDQRMNGEVGLGSMFGGPSVDSLILMNGWGVDEDFLILGGSPPEDIQ